MCRRPTIVVVCAVAIVMSCGVSGLAQINLQIFNTPSPAEIQTNHMAQTSDPSSIGNGILVSGALIANSPLNTTTLTFAFPAPITSSPFALDGTQGGITTAVPV